MTAPRQRRYFDDPEAARRAGQIPRDRSTSVGRKSTAPQRVAAIFEADPAVERVVVFRQRTRPTNKIVVRPFKPHRDYGPHVVGVYGRGVDPADIASDVTKGDA